MRNMTVDIEFEWDEESLRRLDQAGQRAVALAIKYTATDVWANIRKKAPVDTGRLAGSFQMDNKDDLTYRIHSNVHYALYVHEGTGIYGPRGEPIYPTHARFLSFYWKKTGQQMFLPYVLGMEPRPYGQWAMDETEQRLDEFVSRAIREAENEVR